MEKNPNIPIKNIYYMIAYAYRTLSLSEYKKIGAENFENLEDLYSEILSLGIPKLIRSGLMKDYINIEENSNVIKGKININSTIKKNSLINKKIVVTYDDYSENILINQIIKATVIRLSHSRKLCKKKRKLFRSLLPYFSEVSNIQLDLKFWEKIKYNRQNIRYQFVIDICKYLHTQLLFDGDSSSQNIREIHDEQKLSSLYEKFIFEFFKKETDYDVSRPQIKWHIDNEFSDALPIMKTDVVLKKEKKTLIIDTKFYSESMVSRFGDGIRNQKSSNLYQIFSYVNNWSEKPGEIVAGMLLYVKTTSLNQPNHTYHIKGNQFFVLSLDLNQDFKGIKKELLEFANRFFE